MIKVSMNTELVKQHRLQINFQYHKYKRRHIAVVLTNKERNYE